MTDKYLHKMDSKANDLISALNNVKVAENPSVVVYGVLNSGKSSLLNMLTDHISEEYFKTADIRETTTIRSLKYNCCTYIDTPGLDASIIDNLEAEKGLKSGDFVLYVHQIPGQLEKIEIEFLEHAKKLLGKYATQNILIIISKIDNEQDETKLQKIKDAIVKQCSSLLGFQPKIFLISSNRYQKGKKDDKKLLTNKSGIVELINHISELRNNYNSIKDSIFRERVFSIKEELRNIKNEINKKENEMRNSFSFDFDTIKNIFESYKNQKDRNNEEIKRINSELSTVTSELSSLD